MALALTACSHPSANAPATQPTSPVTEPAPPPSPPSDEPSPKPLLSIDWKTIHLATDEDAVALWRQIAPTGADWELRIGELPDEDELQRRLAFALLRGGNFACKPTPPEDGSCADPTLSALPTSTFEDPCLRRELALWALDLLNDEDAPAISRELLAIAALPLPEDELIQEAVDIIPADRPDLLMPMIEAALAAGHASVVEQALTSLSPAQIEQLARKQHSDAAVLFLDPAEARPVFLAAITDQKLLPATRVNAIEALAIPGEPLKKDLRAALIAAVKDPSCDVAAKAITSLSLAGDNRHFPKASPPSTIPAALRNLCLATAVSSDSPVDNLLRNLINKRGLQLFDHAEITAEPGESTGEVVLPADLITLPFLSELAPALERCAPTPATPRSFTCKDASLRFELTFEADRSLRRIERFADPTPCP